MRSHRVVRAALAVTVLASGLSVGVGAIRPAAADTNCGRALFIGARGSGESGSDNDGLGIPVTATRDSLLAYAQRTTLSASDIHFESVPATQYPAISIPGAILENGGLPSAFWAAYEGSVSDGSNWLTLRLLNRARSCPNERFVLVGYSQGAQVVTDALITLQSVPSITKRIAGVVLFGSPVFSPNDQTINVELPKKIAWSSSRQGIYRALRSQAPLGSTSQLNVVGNEVHIGSWCLTKDAICNYSAGDSRALVDGSSTHFEYPQFAKDAGKTLADDIKAAVFKKVPPPPNAPLELSVDSGVLPHAQQGLAYEQPITVGGGRPPYTLDPEPLSGGLPPGITVGDALDLRGTPTRPGTFQFELGVTDALGQRATAAFTLIVDATSLTPTAPELVSVNAAGTAAGSRYSGWSVALSADGRYVAFASMAKDLVARDQQAVGLNVFVRDRAMGTTQLVSQRTDGSPMEEFAGALNPKITADGRYIAFDSDSAVLVDQDSNESQDVFLRDIQAGTTTRVSVSGLGIEIDGTNQVQSISPNGRYVVFNSDSATLSGGATGLHLYVRDIYSATTTRIDAVSSAVGFVNDAGTVVYRGGNEFGPGTEGIFRWTKDGGRQRLADPGLINVSDDGKWLIIYQRDRAQLIRIDTDTLAQQTLSTAGGPCCTSVDGLSVSRNGTATFSTNAPALTTLAGMSGQQVYQALAWSMDGRVALVSAATDGSPGNDRTYATAISADAGTVGMFSSATNLVTLPDLNNDWDVFVAPNPLYRP
ncbi:cutinase family protein [Micromonospora soli]|uniref:cutinase family protein n=1 Tax=Micromonospora sp. NBRC 110009 TaxID=3061627 RepID=UPI0026713E64|nr:cutinase family protein [Micromonospora sp. NBRC 110009]WKT96823.1 cutinase family protein [Micromonospora sp. NBRC 110009]